MPQIIDVPGHGQVEFPDGMSDADIVAAIQRNTAPAQPNVSQEFKSLANPELNRSGEVLTNAARSAVAGIPDMFLNAPTNAANLALAGVGSVANAVGKPDYAPSLIQTPNLVRGYAEKQGWIKPQAEPQTQGERYLAAGAQGATAGAMGGLPGMLVGAGSNVVGQAAGDLTDSPTAGILAGLLASKGANSLSDYGASRIAMANELKSQKQPYMDTLQELRGAGYAIPPNLSNPNLLNSSLQGIGGGRYAVGQSFSNYNNEITDAMMRSKLGLPSNAPIDKSGIKSAFDTAAQPYNDMSTLAGLPPPVVGTRLGAGGLGPLENMYGKTPTPPSVLLERWKQANNDAKDFWIKYTKGHDPADKVSYDAAISKSIQLTDEMKSAAEAAGRPEMVKALQDARVRTAQIGDIQRASNLDTGSVSAIDLANARGHGVPLTDELLTAAKLGSNFPSAAQPFEKLGGGSALTSMLGTGAGAALGQALAGPAGGVIGAGVAPFAVNYGQGAVRNFLRSPYAQKKLGTPVYDASLVGRTASKIPITTTDEALLRAYIQAQQLQGQQ